jgi:hypothetical protein
MMGRLPDMMVANRDEVCGSRRNMKNLAVAIFVAQNLVSLPPLTRAV